MYVSHELFRIDTYYCLVSPAALVFIPKQFVPVSPMVPKRLDVEEPEPVIVEKVSTPVVEKTVTPPVIVEEPEPVVEVVKEETPVVEVIEVPVVVVVEEEAKIEPDPETNSPAQNSRKRRHYNVMDLLNMRPGLSDCPIPESLINAPCFRKRDRPTERREERSHKRSNKRHHNNPHDTAPALEDCKPLEVDEATRWKPKNSRKEPEEESDEVFLKSAKSVLNKLSIEKFQKLSDQFIEIAVKSQFVLTECIRFVVEKAQMEWHFSSMYAELCFKLAATEMPRMENVQDTSKLFRSMLLSHCQKLFEQDTSAQVEALEKLSDADRAEQELILKRKTLGHIRFIGELFKHHMLSSRIMHFCIQQLFGADVQNVDEEALECLCKLFATIGEKLERFAKDEAELKMIEQYFDVIKNLSENSDLCTRVRFMLKDLLDLRRNQWVARREETKAMTLAEIHQKAAQEQKQKNNNGRRPPLKQSHSFNGSSSKQEDGGWETVPQRPKNVKSRSTGRVSSFNSRKPPTTTRGGKKYERASPAPQRPALNLSRSKSDVAAPKESTSTTPMERQVFERKVKSNLAELFSIEDVTDAATCMSDLLNSMKESCVEEYDVDLMISTCMNIGLDKGEKEQCLIGQVLAKTFETSKLLQPEVVSKGVFEVLEFLEDFLVDIPLAIPYTIRMLAPLVQVQGLTFPALLTNVDHLASNGKAAILVLGLLQQIDSAADFIQKHQTELIQLFATEQRTLEHLEAELAKNNLN